MTDPKIPAEQQVIYEEEFHGPSKELRVLGAVCYAPGGFILPYVLDLGHEPFVLFHVKQGFALFLILLVLALFPGIGGTSGLAFFLYIIFGGWHAYQAFQGKEYRMGIIRKFINKP